MLKPIRVLIGGQELENYTSLRLSRSKKDLTGSLTVEIFIGYMPSAPIITNAAVAQPISVYTGGQLSFYGSIDSRNGKPVKQKREANGRFASGYEGEGGTLKGALTSDGYKVTLTARGQAKRLIDSSHQHKTGSMLKTTNKKVIEELIKPFKIKLDWQAKEIDMPVVRFSDGGTVFTELQEIANETCIYLYETRDGKLRAIDKPGSQMGEPMILGQNILDFDAEQSESKANSTIVVKGQRSDPNIHGKDAVQRVKILKDNWVPSDIPLTIQFYGDATDEALERRGKLEADQRAQQAKNIRTTMFGVLQQSGQPFDVGNLHYVEIPPEGVFEVLECIEVEYTVDASGTYQTVCTMAPPPSSGVSGGASKTSSLTQESLPGYSDAQALGAARRAQFNISLEPGSYPLSWGPASLAVTVPQPPNPLNPLLEAVVAAAPLLVLKD